MAVERADLRMVEVVAVAVGRIHLDHTRQVRAAELLVAGSPSDTYLDHNPAAVVVVLVESAAVESEQRKRLDRSLQVPVAGRMHWDPVPGTLAEEDTLLDPSEVGRVEEDKSLALGPDMVVAQGRTLVALVVAAAGKVLASSPLHDNRRLEDQAVQRDVVESHRHWGYVSQGTLPSSGQRVPLR